MLAKRRRRRPSRPVTRLPHGNLACARRRSTSGTLTGQALAGSVTIPYAPGDARIPRPLKCPVKAGRILAVDATRTAFELVAKSVLPAVMGPAVRENVPT